MRYKFGLFFEPVLGWERHLLSQNFKIFREWFHQQIIHLKVPFTFSFHLSLIFLTNLDLFDPFLGWWLHYGKSKLQNFEIEVSKTNTAPQISLYSWLSSLYHDWYMKYKFGLFWPNFGLMTSPRESKLLYFEKWFQKQAPHFKVALNIDFDLFINLDKVATTLGPFYPIWR